MKRMQRATKRVFSVVILLATCAAWPALPPDELLLIAALRERGIEARPATWDDPAVRWEDADAVVVRATWDYHHRHAEFMAWIHDLERRGVPLWNPPSLLRWNSEKTYLRDLAAGGVRVVDTHWSDAGEMLSLGDIVAGRAWRAAVVKPAISATAHETFRIGAVPSPDEEARFTALRAKGTVLVQPLVEEIVTAGEWSICCFGGAFSHAILKRPLVGDFRVQSEFGGSAERLDPPAGLVAEARMVLARVRGPWLYARVDGCMVDGHFVLLELEMLEPSFFLDLAPGAADRFADAIVRL